MKRILVFALFIISACSTRVDQKPFVEVIHTAELEEMMHSNNDLLLIDVRTSEEIAYGQISGALHVDLNDPEFNEKASEIEQDAPIVVYCASGMRSAVAARRLADLGYKRIYDYTDGYNGWVSR